MVRSLIEKVFEGFASDLVLQALSSERATKEELAEIRRILDQMEERAESPEAKG